MSPTDDTATDGELLRQYFAAAFQDAFRRLTDRHVHWMYSAALRRLRDPALADDAVQAAFLVLLRRGRSLTEARSITPWLFRVLDFACRDLAKQHSRRTTHEKRAASMRADATTPSTDETVIWKDLAPALEALVSRLRRADREVVLLRYYRQLEFPDIAAALGVSEAAARKRANRAITRLRSMASLDRFVPAAIDAVLISHVVSAAPANTLAAVASLGTSGAAAVAVTSDTARRVATHLVIAKSKLAAAIAVAIGTAAATVTTVAVHRRALPPPVTTVASRSYEVVADRPDAWPTDGAVRITNFHVVLDATAARAVSDATAAEPEPHLRRADAGELLALLRAQLLAGHVLRVGAYAGWTESNDALVTLISGHRPPAVPRALRGFDYLGSAHAEYDVSPAGPDSARLVTRAYRLHLEPTPGYGPIDLTAQFDKRVAPGEALVLLSDGARLRNTTAHYLAVYVAIKVSPVQHAYLDRLRDPLLWLDGSPFAANRAIDQAIAWEKAAATVERPAVDAWRQTLPGGTLVRLLGVNQPDLNPLLWWDGDGLPVRLHESIRSTNNQRNSKVTACVVVEVTDPHRPSVSSKIDPAGRFPPGVRTEITALTGPPSHKVGVGDGPLQPLGRLDARKGAVATVGATTFAVDDLTPANGQTFLNCGYNSVPDVDVQVIAVDRQGAEYFAHNLANPVEDRQPFHDLIEFPVAPDQIDHFEIRTRPRRWVTFSDFATEPAYPLPKIPGVK